MMFPSSADGVPEVQLMKHHWQYSGFFLIAMIVAAAQAWPADPAPAPATDRPKAGSAGTAARPTGPDVVTLNFINADIEGVVKAVGEITGKNFMLDPRVKGTVNIVSAKPLPKALVYDVFLSALRLQGYAAIEERGIITIVPEADAKLHQSPTLGPDDKSRAAGEQIQTQVFTLKYESAAQLVAVLRPLIAPNNTITAYQNTNTLVITDYASNLRRLEKIIDSIDQPSGTDPVVIALRYASALDVAQAVNRLFAETAPVGNGADANQRMMIVADARSNSLLARSDNPSRLARLRSLVATLDSPTSVGGNIHVVYLRNAEAVKVAETLRAIYQGESAPMTSRTAPPAAVALISPLASAPAPGATASPTMPPQNSYPAPLASQPQSTAATHGIIQADAATNSIIITAPDAIYNNLRAVVEKLDSRRVQVYVEALIAEVTANKAAEFGVQWQQLTGANSTNSSSGTAFGGTNFGGPGQNIIGITQNPASAGAGLNVGFIKGTVSIPGINGQILNMGLLIRALESDSSANILSTPTLLTLDNEEARIVVGQNLPFITGQYALSGAATTPTPFQTIVRQDVGLQLRIKPQVSAGGTVRLQIYQEVSSVQDSTNAAGIITNKRSVESNVLVDDGQIVVIGGLIQDTVNDSLQRVPVLGEIPLIGNLFQYKTRSRSKTNLMVFLRTTVLRDADRADGLTNDRYDYILGEQRKVQPANSAVLPKAESPTLPPRVAPVKP
jgi:general secretion pathway protein D